MFKYRKDSGAAMTDSDGWLERYAETHKNLTYPMLYWTAIPMVVTGLVGLLWSLPVPAQFYEISPLLNWGSAFLMVSVVYYFIISGSLAIGMLPVVFGISSLAVWLERSPFEAALVSLILFSLSIAGLFLGRRAEGGATAVFEDIQMMMIAPVWLMSRLYRRLGIPF